MLLRSLCLVALFLHSGSAVAQRHAVAGDSALARPACIQASESDSLIRTDTVLSRLPRDSVVLRGGERVRLSDVRPPIIGFTAPPGGFAADSTCRALHPKYIRLFGECYTMFGPPRSIPHKFLTEVGVLHGVTLFFAPGTELHDPRKFVFYVLREEDCRFQPYSVPIF